MACEICNRPTHEWYDCPKKPDGYVPIARREGIAQRPTMGNREVAGGREFEPRLARANSSVVELREKPNRNASRHRPGYFTDYMRKRRAAAKEGK